jgi:hypothetical protein
MKLIELETAVRQHAGEFLCLQMSDRKNTKVVQFAHAATPPAEQPLLPDVGRLRDFYDTFGSVLFYHDDISGDAAKYIAPPAEWAELRDGFDDWIDALSEAERAEFLPDWMDSCVVIGQTPRSGNYLLMATEGSSSGHVFEFDHDGYELTEAADDLLDYIARLLKPDDSRLREMASHMRFREAGPADQWLIRQLTDNAGHIAHTDRN